MMLSLENVEVSIDDVKVLRGVSCSFAERTTTVLIGRNGAGKTTTLRAIMGLLPVDQGAVRFESKDLGRFPAHYRARAGIGYAPEDRRLVAAFNVEENMRLPGVALGLSEVEIRRRLDEIYQLLPQVHAMRSRPGTSVSGGQGKIVALGRALMAARKALLLDEPFQGLAPALALDYARALKALRASRPELMMLITESAPKLLDEIADHTLQIERGEIASSTAGPRN